MCQSAAHCQALGDIISFHFTFLTNKKSLIILYVASTYPNKQTHTHAHTHTNTNTFLLVLFKFLNLHNISVMASNLVCFLCSNRWRALPHEAKFSLNLLCPCLAKMLIGIYLSAWKSTLLRISITMACALTIAAVAPVHPPRAHSVLSIAFFSYC